MSEFKGKINISRDLRKNKQVIISHYDMVDVLFILLGVGSGILVAFLLGFFFKVVDEFSAIFIGFIPTIIIVTLGFRRVAGIRYIAYLMMKKIDKKKKCRININNVEGVVDNNITKEKKIRNVINKKIKIRSNIKDKSYILPFEVVDKEDVTREINKFLSYENVDNISYRICKNSDTDKTKHILVLNIKYKNIDELYKNMIDMFFNRKDIKSIPIEYIEERENNIDKSSSEVFLLHLYDKKKYSEYIDKIKEYGEVIIYIKKICENIYVNTYILVSSKNGDKNIEKDEVNKKVKDIKEVSKECNVILNTLNMERGISKVPVKYYMQNPYNAYRRYD